MATFAYAAAEIEAVQDVLVLVSKPSGVSLDSVHFGEDSNGDASIFVTYAVEKGNMDAEKQATLLRDLVYRSRDAIRPLNLPYFSYISFRSKQS